MPLAKGGTIAFANALSIVAAWETWYLPRPQPVDPVLIDSPDAWELDAHYPGGFEPHTFPPKPIPISMASREANLIGYLSPQKGNMGRLLYETSHSIIQQYWKYAHHFAVQHSHTNNEYYSWDKFVEDLSSLDLSGENWSPPTDFDSRFYYYSKSVNLTEDLSTETGRQTTEEDEVAKTGFFSMNEFPSLEMKLIPEDSELEKGKKRGLEGAMQPPPQERRKGGSRGSSVPPGSATDLARQRAQAMTSQDMKGKGSTKRTSKGKDTSVIIAPVGKLPSDFQAMSSTQREGDTPMEERKKKIFNRTYYERTWGILKDMLSSLGTATDNIPVFEHTYLHWFRYMEAVPMSVPLEALLQPLYEAECDSYIADLPQDVSEETMASNKEIIVDTLTNVKNFISSYGVITRDFFDQDKSRFTLNTPWKGGSKGSMSQQFPPLGGKGKGKSGSTNKPKEPASVPKQGEVEPPSKPQGAAIATPLRLQTSPAKVGGAGPLVVTKHPTIVPDQPKPKAQADVTADDQRAKAETPTAVEQSKAKAEVTVVADQPKPKAEATLVTEQPKAKAEIVPTDLPKAKADPVVKADPPKAVGQPKSLLSLASLKGRLGWGPPSKPERPPEPTQVEVEALEDDEDADMQAALHESMKAPSSPQSESGAQSSTPRPAVDLDQQESDLITQLDRLMEESVRRESLPNPSIRDSSRLRSIDVVSRGIEKQLEEITARRASSPSVAQPQESATLALVPGVAKSPPRSGSTAVEVKVVTPPSGQPLTIEKLMSGTKADTTVSPPRTTGIQDQPKVLPMAPSVDHPKPKNRSPVSQAKLASPPRAIPSAVPAIEDRPTARREAEVSPKERERTPRREPSHERRPRSPSPLREHTHVDRQSSPAQSRERSQERRRRRRSPTPRSEYSRERKRRSPTPRSELSRERKKEGHLHLAQRRR